jgi:hypothetical protein
MVLKAHDVEAHHVGQPRELEHGVRLTSVGPDEHTELEIVPVVGHRRPR